MSFYVNDIPTVRMDSRLGFQYVENSTIFIKDGRILVAAKGTPAYTLCGSNITCLLLGVGTSISRDAVRLLSDCCTTVLWCGKRGMSMYTVGLNTNSSMKNAKTQIERIMNHRMSLWKKLLYARNISYKDTDNVKELLLLEASVMKKFYAECAEKCGVAWNGRIPQVSKMDPSDKVNFSITVCNMALYGVATACISGMGYLPQFGIVHGSGATPLSYDIADTVKTITSIPVAMEYVASHDEIDINELLTILARRINNLNITVKFADLLVELFQRRI